MPDRMRLLVTRPQPQADEWVQALRAQGIDAFALPLIEIAPAADLGALRAAWATLPAQRMVMFVSPNAADRFFAERPAGAPWPSETLAAATGPGTSQALRALGVADACIVEPPADSALFDSEALWQQIQARAWQGQQVLVVRGEGGRDWLAEQLTARGAQVNYVEAYRRVLPRWSAVQQALLHDAVASPDQSAWLFSSSVAVHNLARLAAGANWARAKAWASHPRIAQAAVAVGFAAVITVAPTQRAIAAAWAHSIQSMRSSAP